MSTGPNLHRNPIGGECWFCCFFPSSRLQWFLAKGKVGLSLLMGLPWLILEPIMILRGRIFGDLSGLWFLNRPATLAFLLFLIGSRVAILWWAS